MDWGVYLAGLATTLVIGLAGWLATLPRENVNLVDSLWSVFLAGAAVVYWLLAPASGWRALLVVLLVLAWGLRLAIHLALRNWGKPEDRRYRAIRENNSPGFAWKSLYVVFGLQAVLAWVISLSLHAAILSVEPFGLLDALGAVLVLVGLAMEAIADRQLQAFKENPESDGQVLDTGLWRYSRHPNYFGEACVWWGLWLIATAGGGWWSLISPLLMTLLLLKISGVVLLEKDIGERRPGYREYARRTSAFVPWPPGRKPFAADEETS